MPEVQDRPAPDVRTPPESDPRLYKRTVQGEELIPIGKTGFFVVVRKRRVVAQALGVTVDDVEAMEAAGELVLRT